MAEIKQAKYVEIENYIKHQIDIGKFSVGDKIPTEKELSIQFQTSVLTVNKALKNLEYIGYLKRIQGKGSFVIEHSKINKHIGSFDSFTQSMEKLQKKAGSILVEYRMLKGSDIPDIAKKLQCRNDEFIHFFERIRTGDDEKVAVSYTYIPYKVINMIDIQCLSHSLHEYLASADLIMDHYDIDINAQMPSKEQRRQLEISDVPLLVNRMTLYTERNIAFEYVETYYIGSRFTYSASFNS